MSFTECDVDVWDGMEILLRLSGWLWKVPRQRPAFITRINFYSGRGRDRERTTGNLMRISYS